MIHSQGHADLPVADTLRGLLAHLLLWQQESSRREFLEFTLPGHPALADFRHDGQPLAVATELVNRLRHCEFQALRDGTHPVCALLREIRTRREDGNRTTAERIAVLARFFGCDPPPRVALTGAPYPGLMAYDWGQDPVLAGLFCGREPETLDLVGRLRAAAAGGLLIVSGASGSGKSSLVKAGLWRALAAGSQDQTPEPIPGCRDWVVSAMTPALDGDAFLTLVNSVRGHWRDGRLRPLEEARRLRTDPGAFPDFLHRLLQGRPAWLLILDQLEEVFTPDADPYRDAFIALLLRASADPRLRVVATLRADFQPQVIAHPGLRAVLNGGGTYYVGAPGPLALARMIEGPAQAVGLAVEPALTAQLVAEADREPGGLALLAAALQDTWLAAADAPTLTLRHYSKAVGGIKGVLSRRGRRGLALLWPQGRATLPRVFGQLIHVDAETGATTRRRAPLDRWPPDSAERRLIEVFSRDADRPRDAVRLLVCGAQGGQATVEVAHEALLREWPRLALWIRTRREALIRRDEVRRDAARWDERGRPDHLLPHPELLAEVRARLDSAGLWEDLRRDQRIAWFLAQDDPADLGGLTLEAFRHHGRDGALAALPLLAGLTAPGRTWETSAALGRWVLEQEPGLADWLRAGLAEVLGLLGNDDALSWHRRRLGIGDLMAALGDDRPGVGLRPDGLPAIDWVQVAPAGLGGEGTGPGIIGRVERIARYPVTNAQYLVFAEAEDYQSPDWWLDIDAPEPLPSSWTQPNRPRVYVAWLEAMAYCRWLTARYRAAGLIAAGDQIRLPTEGEWEGAVRAGTGWEYPWGNGYRVGHANLDEVTAKSGPHNLGQTTAVGLYPQGASPSGLRDCAGNVWEWCLNKYEAPDDTDASGNAGRSLRGGSWSESPANARAVRRNQDSPDDRGSSVGFRLVCSCPIPLNTDPLNTDH